MREDVLVSIINTIYPSSGSYLNIKSITESINPNQLSITERTVSIYVLYLIYHCLFNKIIRCNMKRWKFLEELSKYYPTDSMIRNTIPDFKQTDKFHLLECVIYNELIQRGYNVVIVLVYLSGEKSYQVDFVAKGNIHQYYLQISYSLSNDELMNQKLNTFKKIKC